ncbi:hypothetical protein FOZ62_026928 [Perkinsus olseni]|uniref:Uncharacterized protein n=3 Tax=Perkinsus olseni TaxID=32597 RepID=A0A7J6Q3U1_PEROL|nr:hypothetical protein FOZ62_026928 [Perkinsus olseni]
MSDGREATSDSLILEVTAATDRLSSALTRKILAYCEEYPSESRGLLDALVSHHHYTVIDRLCTRGGVNEVAEACAGTGAILRLSPHNTRKCIENYLLGSSGSEPLLSLVGVPFVDLAKAQPSTADYFLGAVWQQHPLTPEQAVALVDCAGPDVFLAPLGRLWAGPLLPVTNTMAIAVAVVTLLRYRPGSLDHEISQSLLDGVHNRLGNVDPDQRAMAMALMEVVARKVWAADARVFPQGPDSDEGAESWRLVWKAGMGEEPTTAPVSGEKQPAKTPPAASTKDDDAVARKAHLQSRLVEALSTFQPLPALESATRSSVARGDGEGAWLASCDAKLAAPPTNEPPAAVDGDLPSIMTLGNLVIARASNHEGPLEERLRIESAIAGLPEAIRNASAAELSRVGPTTIYNLIMHSRGDDADTMQATTARHLAGQIVAKDCLRNADESRCLRYVLQCIEKADWAVGTRAEALKVLVEASAILAGREAKDDVDQGPQRIARPATRTRRRLGLRELEESGHKSNRWSQGRGGHDTASATENHFVAQWMPLFLHPVLAYTQSKRCRDQPVLLAECLRACGQLLQAAGVSARSAPQRSQVVHEVLDVVANNCSHKDATVRKACMMLCTCVLPLIDPSELSNEHSSFLKGYMNRTCLVEPDDRTREQAARLRDLVQ